MSLLFVTSILIWIVSTLYKFFFTPHTETLPKRLYAAVAFNSKSRDLELASVFQTICYVWIFAGILLLIIGKEITKGFTGSLTIAMIILLPLWIVAGFYEQKATRRR